MSSNDKQPINQDVLNKLKISVFLQEKNNAKTKKKSDNDMVETIRKIIMQEVDKNDN